MDKHNRNQTKISVVHFGCYRASALESLIAPCVLGDRRLLTPGDRASTAHPHGQVPDPLGRAPKASLYALFLKFLQLRVLVSWVPCPEPYQKKCFVMLD